MSADAPEAAAGPRPGPVTPSLGLALGLWGASMVLMLLVFGLFYLYQTRARELTLPQFTAAVSLIAVLAPTLVACLAPPRWGGLGRLPAYARPHPAVLAGAFFVSLPLYTLSAAALMRGGSGGLAAAPLGLGALLGIWLAYALLPALAEELMYRGVIQPAIAARWGAAWGIGVTAVLFACSHMDAPGLVPRLVMGAWFGFLAWRTGSLLASTCAHALNNTWGVALLAVPALGGMATWQITALSLACLGAALACFEAAGWLAGPREPASAPYAVDRLSATVPLDRVADLEARAPSPQTTSPPDGPAGKQG